MNAVLGNTLGACPSSGGALGPSETPTRPKIHPRGEGGEEGRAGPRVLPLLVLIPMVEGGLGTRELPPNPQSCTNLPSPSWTIGENNFFICNRSLAHFAPPGASNTR